MDSVYSVLFGAFPNISKEQIQVLPEFVGQQDGLLIDGELNGFITDNLLGGINVSGIGTEPLLSTTPDGFGGEAVFRGSEHIGYLRDDAFGHVGFEGIGDSPSISTINDGLDHTMFTIDGDIVGSSAIDASGADGFTPIDLGTGIEGAGLPDFNVIEHSELIDAADFGTMGDITDLGDSLDSIDALDCFDFLDLF